jgi:hypothetical protein
MAYTRAPAGRVTRLSVAGSSTPAHHDKDGKVTESPLPPEQIDASRWCAMPWARRHAR